MGVYKKLKAAPICLSIFLLKYPWQLYFHMLDSNAFSEVFTVGTKWVWTGAQGGH